MKKLFAMLLALIMVMTCLTGCTESEQISYNISKEADNFNVTRKLTVINARTDTVLLEMIGTFALENNSSSELEIICEVADGKYQKHFVYLNEYTLYVVEDISGASVVDRDNQIEKAHRQLINSVLTLAGLAGFQVESRIVLRHRETGRIFK